MQTIKPACMRCKHYNFGKGTLNCKAYSERIPDEIFIKRNPHTEPVEGDNGIRFEKR